MLLIMQLTKQLSNIARCCSLQISRRRTEIVWNGNKKHHTASAGLDSWVFGLFQFSYLLVAIKTFDTSSNNRRDLFRSKNYPHLPPLVHGYTGERTALKSTTASLVPYMGC